MTSKKKIKNTGLIHKSQDPSDFQLGKDDGFFSEVHNKEADWSDYLPQLERQEKYGLETKGCVSFSYNNCIETLHKYQYGERINFSDRFLAKISGTTKNGNWYKDVAQAARDNGLVTEQEYPWPSDVNTWDEFYKEIPDDIIKKAQKFLEKYETGYQWVGNNGVTDEELRLGLKYSPLQVSVYAWGKSDSRGVYHDPDWVTSAADTNHATMLFNVDSDGYKYIFDHYDDEIKKLAPDYYISSAMGHSLNINYMFDLIKGDKDEDIYAVKSGVKHHIPTEYCLTKGVKLGLWQKDWETKEQSEVEALETGASISFIPNK